MEMTEFKNKIKQIVYDYVKENNRKVNSVDIAQHVCKDHPVNADVPLLQLTALQEEGKVHRVHIFGATYTYEVTGA